MRKNLLSELQTLQNVKLTVKQERVVQVAIRLFAEKGYSNTSTAEIAKAADVSEGTIFKQYGTKEKLLLSLIVSHLKELLPSMADELFSQTNKANSTFEQFITAFLKDRVEFGTENREIVQVVIKELIYNEELRNEILPYFAEVITSRFTQVIDHFKERGELMDIATDRIVKMIVTYITGFLASNFVLLNKESIEEEEIESSVRFIMKGIVKPSSDL